jgi:methylenetetrahydrofolate reductase (NADPH)
MFEYPYIVEILTPKRSSERPPEDALSTFAAKYRRVLDAGYGVSIPDNPMGQPRISAPEAIEFTRLPVDPKRVVMNLNTFHGKNELDRLLKSARQLGIKYLLVVRGDGGPLLSKLDPAAIGGRKSVAASSDLIRHLNTAHAGQFVTGAAFNPYGPSDFELNKMKAKVEAGAQFIITQPIIGKDPQVDRLSQFDIPVVVEAWMSKNIDLLYKSVRREKDAAAAAYDPVENLKTLHEAYPGSCIYLSLLSFKQDWNEILPAANTDKDI